MTNDKARYTCVTQHDCVVAAFNRRFAVGFRQEQPNSGKPGPYRRRYRFTPRKLRITP